MARGLAACTRLAAAAAAVSAVASSPLQSRVSAVSMSTAAGAAPPRITQDRARNNLITIAPGEGMPHTATVIGPIHGLGDSNMGWADVAMQLQSAMPYCKFILPNAPVRPVTLNGGMSMPSWYDITSLDKRESQPCTGIEESRQAMLDLISAEVTSGIPPSRIAIAGFSQGGAVALFTGLQYSHTLAGVLCLSGYLAAEERFKLAPEAVNTPVAHFHGSDDQTVQIKWARGSQAHLRELGIRTYELKEYSPLGHSASQQEIADVLAWLQARLPEDA